MAANGSSDASLHRSHGQSIRHINDRYNGVAETVEHHEALIQQHDRDIKMLKAEVYNQSKSNH